MQQDPLIGPRTGQAFDVRAGQVVTVIDVEGGQVADFYAESADDPDHLAVTGPILHPVK
jgi:uncharacterized protein YcgI (DUF1989 family)